MDALTSQLAGCRLFTGKTRAQIQPLIDGTGFKLVDFKQGTVIARMEDYFPYLGIILAGRLELHFPLLTGNTLCIKHKTTGGMFGGAVAFSGRRVPFPYTIVGVDRGKLFLLPAKAAVALAKSDPDIGGNLFEIFSQRVLDYKERLELLSYSAIQKKIALYLFRRLRQDRDPLIVLPFSKSKWAQYLNVSRPSLMRELKAMENQGLLTIRPKSLCINDPQGLEVLLLT